MPVYTIQTPEGRKLKIEAADEATAIKGAEEWSATQKPAAQPKAPAKAKEPSFGETWVGTMTGARDKLVSGVKRDLEAQAQAKPSRNLLAAGREQIDSLGRTGRLVGDAFNLAVSPITGLTEAAIVQPYGNLMSGVTGTADDGWEEDMRTALMAARPGVRSAPVPKPVSPKRLARAETVAKFDQAGVDPTMAAVDGGGSAKVANAVAENPAGFRQRAQLRKSIEQAGEKSRAVARGYGEARGPQITGENVKAGVNRFARGRDTAPVSKSAPAKQSSFAAKAEALYDDAFSPIETAEGQAVARSMNDFEASKAQAANQRAATIARQEREYEAAIAAERNRVELLRARGYREVPPADIPRPKPPPEPELTPQRPAVQPTQTNAALREMSGRVNAPRLSSMITDGRIKSILGALEEDGAAVRFNDLRALRTWVRNAQRDPTLRQGMDQAGLQRIEQALTSDIYANAERLAGPEALRDLRRADTYYRAGSQRINRALQPFDDAASGESAYARILQAAGSTATADAQKVLSLKRSLSAEEWGDVSANVVAELGKPAKGAAGAIEPDAFSVNTFVTNYNKLSPRARAVIFDSVGGGGAKASALRKELDNLVFVADKLKAVEKGANSSNTGTAMQAAGTVIGLANPATTIPTAKVLGGLMLSGEAVTNPAVVRWMARIGQAETRGPQEVSVVVKQLENAAKTNAALMPLYQESMRLLAPPRPLAATPAAAEDQPPE